MGKRKHDDGFLADLPDESGEPVQKSKKLNSNEEDEYDVWLVRKPKSVSMDILNEIKFPKSIRDKQTFVDLKEDEGDTLTHDIDFKVLKNQTFVLDSENGRRNNDNSEDINVKCQIGGVVNITCISNISDGFPMPPEEDFKNPNDEVDNVSFPFVIKRINRKPHLKLDHLKQRLQAFGSIKKKEKKKKRKEKLKEMN